MVNIEVLDCVRFHKHPQCERVCIVEESPCREEGSLVDCLYDIICPKTEEVVWRQHDFRAGVVGVGSIGISTKGLLEADRRDRCGRC